MAMRFLWVIVWGGIVLGVAGAAEIGVWANNGEEKVPREDLWMTGEGRDVRNSVFDGRKVRLTAGRNETVAFNLVIESPEEDVVGVSVRAGALRGVEGGAEGEVIEAATRDDREGVFDYRGRNLELFYVRYLPIRGVSRLSYEHFDERHVPLRFRRPHDAGGFAKGQWEDRPDHDKHYPDIAVPIEWEPGFTIRGGESQAIWGDVYVPTGTTPGVYRGEVVIEAENLRPLKVPLEVEVIDFTLPQLPTARTMMYVSREDVFRRATGNRYEDTGTADQIIKGRAVLDRHFQMAHRHRVSLIDEHTPIGIVDDRWRHRLDGSLFTAERGYAGTGVRVGNNVFSIGTYGAWPWKDGNREAMWRATDRWVKYFEGEDFGTPTDYFLYLADESDAYSQIERWSKWVSENPGPGRIMPTLATTPMPKAMAKMPSLTLPCSTVAYGITEAWERAVEQYRTTPGKSFQLYNGGRIGSGSLALEDDGVALRTLGWCQWKFKPDRWFIWQGTYYENYQGGMGETKLFSTAHTFGGGGVEHDVYGETGGNYNNGDGVMFYPGTDVVHPEESYDVAGPIASLRLKHWRRGLQDYEYLHAAAKIDPERVERIVDRMVPKVLWEVGVTDVDDPSYVRGDISWSIDPDDWEAARAELAAIIVGGSGEGGE